MQNRRKPGWDSQYSGEAHQEHSFLSSVPSIPFPTPFPPPLFNFKSIALLTADLEKYYRVDTHNCFSGVRFFGPPCSVLYLMVAPSFWKWKSRGFQRKIFWPPPCLKFTSVGPFTFMGPFSGVGPFACAWPFYTYTGPLSTFHPVPRPGWGGRGWSTPALLLNPL